MMCSGPSFTFYFLSLALFVIVVTKFFLKLQINLLLPFTNVLNLRCSDGFLFPLSYCLSNVVIFATFAIIVNKVY